MVEIIRFKAEHIWFLSLQEYDSIELGGYNLSFYKHAEKLNHAYTIVVNGVICACVGLVEYWENRAEVWTIIDKNSGKYFYQIVKAMKKLISNLDTIRIEATVVKDFKQGHRLVKLFGFELECECMRKYGVTGLDYSLYARVK